jgi:hypothetical protein
LIVNPKRHDGNWHESKKRRGISPKQEKRRGVSPREERHKSKRKTSVFVGPNYNGLVTKGIKVNG